jgi:hypothetical protein
MKYRLQFSPISGTRESHADQLSLQPSPFANSRDANFFRSWLVYDSDLEAEDAPDRLHGNMVLGLSLAVMISATFWVGVGLMIERLWR